MSERDAIAQAVAELRTLRTELSNPDTALLSELSADEVVACMHRADHAVAVALEAASAPIADAARRLAAAIERGGRLVIIGAGTGGRLAFQEISELPPTFGISADAVFALAAGRAGGGAVSITESEDDIEAAPAALHRLGVGANDVVIGVAASGRTPFVLAGVRSARELSACSVGIANNPRTPLLDAVELPILLDTGPEVITGSTRLKAGTAQKVALNRITTAAFVLAGRVRGNHMTHMRVHNDKLRARAVLMVADLLDIDEQVACELLMANGWDIPACLTGKVDAFRRCRPS